MITYLQFILFSMLTFKSLAVHTLQRRPVSRPSYYDRIGAISLIVVSFATALPLTEKRIHRAVP